MESIIKNNLNTTDLCNKLKSAEKQYPPLNKVQELALIKKYKKDRDKLNQLLFMHNIRLVFNIAKKYVSKTNDFDCLVQDGMVGLGEAAKRFDITKDVKFCTYATIWIKKYILMNFYGKNVDMEKHCMSLDQTAGANLDPEEGNSLDNYIYDYVDPSVYCPKSIESELSANELSKLYKQLIKNVNSDNNLSVTDKAVFFDTVCNKERPKEVAEKYNISVNDVSLIKSKILSKLKDVLHSQYKIDSYEDLS